jgi:hypothetical protein
MHFDRASGGFALTFDADPMIAAPTEIYVPQTQYPNGCTFDVAGGHLVFAEQLASVRIEKAERITITIKRQ